MGFIAESLGLKRTPTPNTQQLAEGGLIGQITPFGNVQVGQLDPTGQFEQVGGAATVRVQETPFQEQFRTGQEDIALGLLGQVSPQLQQPTITPRTAQQIRGILPSAQALDEGLPSIRTAGQIESGLSPIVRPGQFGAEIGRLEEATFEGVRRKLDPQFRRAEERLVQSLSDRGIPLTSRAAQEELGGLRESESEALTRAGLSAVGAGRQEQERLSRLGLATRGQLLTEGVNLANIESGTRKQLFGERQTELQESLRKQLALSELESKQRAAQVREQTGNLSNIRDILGLGGTRVTGPLTTSAGRNAAVLENQSRNQQINRFNETGRAIGQLAGAL